MDTGADAMAVPTRLPWPAAAAVPADGVPDEILVRRIAEGDAAALALLYQRYAGRLFGFLQRSTGDRTVAEEVLQDTLRRCTWPPRRWGWSAWSRRGSGRWCCCPR
jgi:hypothetical protein